MVQNRRNELKHISQRRIHSSPSELYLVSAEKRHFLRKSFNWSEANSNILYIATHRHGVKAQYDENAQKG